MYLAPKLSTKPDEQSRQTGREREKQTRRKTLRHFPGADSKELITTTLVFNITKALTLHYPLVYSERT